MTVNRLAPVAAPEETSAQKLLHAAKSLFARKGFEGASVKEIADSAGVNISLVSYHYGGKEGLYRACIESVGRDALSRIQKILVPAADPADFRTKIEKLMETMIMDYVREPDSVRVLHRECDLEASKLTEDIFKDTLLQVFSTLVRFLEDGQKKGFLRNDLEPLTVATFISSTVGRLVHLDPLGEKHFGVTLRDEAYRTKVLRSLAEIYFTGITPPKVRRK